MHLYFLRHGIAEDQQPGGTDFERRLTEEGREKMRLEAAGLVKLELEPDVIYSSPLPRALETAQIVAGAFGRSSRDIRVEDTLASGAFRLSSLRALAQDQPAMARLLFVGHNPDLALTAGSLVGGAHIDLKKGGLIYVEADRLEPGGGVLRWLLTPRHLL